MTTLALAVDTAFAAPARAGHALPSQRVSRFRAPHLDVQGLPLCEHLCALVAGFDREAGRYVVLSSNNLGIAFETERPEAIIDRAEAILSDLIEVNEWPERGWLLVADIYQDIDALLPWVA